MSRTHKTDPYWVKVNKYGVEHHDHSSFGEEYWRNRAVRDEKGDLVLETATRYCPANAIPTGRVPGEYFYPDMPERDEDGNRIWAWQKDSTVTRPRHVLIHEAAVAIADGEPQRLIVVGTYQRRKTERYLAWTVADTCTIDEKRAHVGWTGGGGRFQPCYMEADWRGEDRNKFRCACCSCSGRDPHFERARRRNKRDQLRKATKLANSGVEDWHEDWNDLKVTTPLRYNVQWC